MTVEVNEGVFKIGILLDLAIPSRYVIALILIKGENTNY